MKLGTSASTAMKIRSLGTAIIGIALVAPTLAHSEPVQEVIVTARKRAEPLQRVPVAVTAFSGEQLIQQGTRTVADLQYTVPSLSTLVSQNGNETLTFNLRGQTGTDVILTIDQAVSAYTDGVLYPRPYGLNTGLVDVQRIEVLKGPQGTLYGHNTTGGAINIITRGADYEGVHGYLSAEAGNYSDQKYSGGINIPLVKDKLAMRLVYQRYLRDGFAVSRVSGEDTGADKNEHYFRGTLRFDPTDSVSMEIKGDWTRYRNNSYAATPRYYLDQPATDYQAAFELGLDPNIAANRSIARDFITNLTALGSADFYTTDYAINLFDNGDLYSVAGTVNWQLAEDVTLKSITGFRHLVSDRASDLDATRFKILDNGVVSPGPFMFPNFPITEEQIFTQEVNLSGKTLNGRLEWLGGMYYSNEKGNDSTRNNFRYDQTLMVNGTTLLPPGRSFAININNSQNVQNKSWAIYSQNDLHITDNLTLTFGGRYTEETKSLDVYNRLFAPSTGLYLCRTNTSVVTANPNDCLASVSTSFSGFGWLASLNYQISPSALLYVKTARASRSGGINARVPAAPPFQPETARDVEVGAKVDWFGGKFRTNVAAYTTKYGNKQETSIVPVNSTPTSIITNAATANIKGVELEVTAHPIEGLTLSGDMSYIDARYKSFPGALSILNVPIDASGFHFSNPPWQYHVMGRYEFPVLVGVFGAQADWSWTSGARLTSLTLDPALPASLVDDMVAGFFNFQNGRASLGLLNLRADYRIDSVGLNIAFFVTNALNKKYQIAGLTPRAIGGLFDGITGEPRMWGFQVTKKFGAGE